MKALFFSRISVVLIFALIGLSAYAGLNPYVKQYDFKEELLNNGWYLWETDLSFKAANAEKLVAGGIGLIAKKNYYPKILLDIAGLDTKLIECGRELVNYHNGMKKGQKLKLTLTNGEVIYTYNAVLYNNLSKDLHSSDVGRIGIQVVVTDFRSDKTRLTSMLNEDISSYIIKKITTFNIKRIAISDMSFNVSTFSASTFKAMFKSIDSKLGTDFSILKPEATVTSITTEHNIFEFGMKGMNIMFDFDVEGLKGKTGKCRAYFYFKNGVALIDNNGLYSSMDGRVSAIGDYTPKYDKTTFTNYRIFIPYNELHLYRGMFDLKAYVQIYDNNNNIISTSEYTYFNFTNY